MTTRNCRPANSFVSQPLSLALFALLLFLLLPAVASAQLGQLISPGELAKAHAKFSGIENCNACHGDTKDVLDSKCLDCHKDLAAKIAAKKGFHADKAVNCIHCHTEHLGKNFDIRSLDRAKFKHDDTGYKLEGFHLKIKDCAACHKTRSLLTAKPDCASCHKDPHRGNLPNCETCHSVSRPWKQIVFDHGTSRYPLTGAHVPVACMTCHKNQTFKGLPFANCTSCHKDPHKGSLNQNCSSCHTTQTWKQVSVKHAQYPLIGKHATVACAACHPGGKWKLTAFARCADCHKDLHLGQFTQTCDTCHTVSGFKPAKFDHSKLKLEQKHKIECAKCHKMEKGKFPAGTGQTVRYKPIKTDCASCHKDVHQGQLGPKCETCHNISDFKVPVFDHSKTRYPLDTVHAKVTCNQCHKPDAKTGAVRYKPLETTCLPCHSDPHLGQLSKDCERCHKPGGLQFDHAQTQYPLTGKHAPVLCKDCHHKEKGIFPLGTGETMRYKPMETRCSACHGDYHKGQFKKDCAECHDTKSFKPSIFTHVQSEYHLLGAHQAVDCAKCHKVEHFTTPPPAADLIRYRPIMTTCVTCHKDPHAGKFGADCKECHNEEAWKGASKAFHKVGLFPLTGRHLSVPCQDCHLNNVVQGTPTRCYDCHWVRRQDDRYRTRLGNECEKCHKTTSWTDVAWNHLAITGVGLNSAHQPMLCDSCHVGGQFTQGDVNCYSCHREQYQNTTQPNHIQAGFPTTCNACHQPSDTSWSTVPFNHNAVFPLVGVHARQQCAACHLNGKYTNTPKECYGCHKAQYDATKSPNHRTAGYSTSCESCHKATDPDWLQANFSHSDFFPLVGVHATQTCTACHKNGVFAGTPRDCYGCHKALYDATTNPNHKAAGYSTNCETCHKPSDPNWNAKFNHNDTFPLVGVHAQQPCAACHKNGVFAGTPRECYGCHKAQYDATTNPNHRTANFPTDCQTCHKSGDTNWNQGKFNHAQVFPLVGAHAHVACASCHKNGVFNNAPKACYGCHKAKYDATTQPNHRTAGFPTNCEACHKATDLNWNQATFNHSQFFPLVGVHAQAACAACHLNGKYAGTPRACYGCHKAKYEATSNPNHRSAGFPTDCEGCHKATDTSWNQGKLNHNEFFQLIGVHAQAACAACHKNGVYKGTPRECYGCHKPQYDATSNPNHRNAGFPTNCEACHKASDSNWNQATFNHNQFFALIGVHAQQPCAACHKNGVYTGTPTDCYGCHKAQYDATNNPNHRAAGFPTSCQECHKASDTNWNQGVFNHTWFPITSGRHSGIACATCHVSPNNYVVFQCTGACHPQGETDGHHREVSGYHYDSASCYHCHPDGRAGD